MVGDFGRLSGNNSSGDLSRTNGRLTFKSELGGLQPLHDNSSRQIVGEFEQDVSHSGERNERAVIDPRRFSVPPLPRFGPSLLGNMSGSPNPLSPIP